MLYAMNTPNNLGLAIHGDYMDFDELYDALHDIIGEDGEFSSYDSVKLHVLALCYDLRHALMGDREIDFVDNGMDSNKMKKLGKITPEKNVYLITHILWPEALFLQMALNDFIYLNHKKCKYPQWDKTTIAIRNFQAAIADGLKEVVSETSFKRLLNIMYTDFPWLDGYATQYLDLLNCRFIKMNKEKRLKSIASMAKNLAEETPEYKEVKMDVLMAARKHQCPVEEIQLELDFPEEYEW